MKTIYLSFLIISILCTSCQPQEEWIQLFNGRDFTGWDIKISGYELNDNYLNTFRVENGLLKVSYDNYEKFDNKFGHIFYNESFSSYRLRVEYRFVNEQVNEGPDWAFRNNGIMIHSQSAESMELKQNFPVSLEVQLLGGDGVNDRSNANLCTPGTIVEIGGKVVYDHCINSTSKTYHGDQWVTLEIVVYADSVIHHILEGDTVLSYSHPRIGNTEKEGPDGRLIKEGHIALQAESHPTEFRKIELLRLKK